MSEEAFRLGRYRHFKGGEYQVLSLATHANTGERLVIYRPAESLDVIYARPLDEFVGTVDRDGRTMRRFEPA